VKYPYIRPRQLNISRALTFSVTALIYLTVSVANAETCSEVISRDLPKTEDLLRQYYADGGTDFEFQVTRGDNESNYFLRRGHNQSHTILTSGEHANIITAYPAGNSATAVFPIAKSGLRLTMLNSPVAVETPSEHGVRYSVSTNQPELAIDYVDVGSTRDVRDYEHAKIKFADAEVHPQILTPNTVLYRRERLDQKGYYSVKIQVLNGVVSIDATEHVSFTSSFGAPVQFMVESLTSDTPLTPLPATQIFKPEVLARMSLIDIQSALYLFTADKILAGTWRYQTYFGRDALLTLIYSADFLETAVIEVELAAVIERMNFEGDPAHEEDVGDIATRRNITAGRGAVNTPIYDYKMVDTVYLLPTLFNIYSQRLNTSQLNHFLDRRTTTGRSFREALRANLHLIVARSQAFAENPVYQNLISFNPGEVVGDWRDSGNGHGATTDQEEQLLKEQGVLHDRTASGGRYSFGVNVGLVPSALRLASEILNRQDLGVYEPSVAQKARANFNAWNSYARPLFALTVSADDVTQSATKFLTENPLERPPFWDQPIKYSALSLNRDGHPIQVMHSDEGFDLLLNTPSEKVLNEVAGSILRPFPYGLSSPVGMVIANPVFMSDATVRARYKPNEYHAGIWGCDMAKMERALNKQLRRTDLSAETREQLVEAHQKIWQMIDSMSDHKKEELWSFKVQDGQIVYIPYEEANAIQLWNLSLQLLQNPYGG
jgi:hypothetical protein